MNTTLSDLVGRSALVTGGGRGIGRAIAVAMARAGARVAVLSRNQAELDETVRLIGANAFAVVGDVTDARALPETIKTVEETSGAIDILVNNAGTLGPIAPFSETDPGEWWKAATVNLLGPVLMTHAILPGMLRRQRGCVINVVTGAAPFAYFSSYSASKSALIRFSECLAAETRAQGVAVFAMAPGTVRTAMSEHSLNSEEGKRWLPWFKRIFDEGLDLPAERPAELAVDLASGRYDALSGLTINPRDDLNEMLARVDEIERDKLYSMRVRTFPSPELTRLGAIREQGARGER